MFLAFEFYAWRGSLSGAAAQGTQPSARAPQLHYPQRETVKGGIEHFQVHANVKKGYILKINNSAMESIVWTVLFRIV